jgi:hypothetical protein
MKTRWLLFKRDERGQIVPMVTILLPTLLLFVALVVNVGQAVNRRVALQLMADTSAFSGATTMAVHLNRMAWANRQIQRGWVIVGYATGIPIPYFWTPALCSWVTWVPPTYNTVADGMKLMINVFNRTGNARASSWARNVAFGDTGNGPELFPGEYQQFSGSFWTSSAVFDLGNAVPAVAEYADYLEPLLDLEDVPEGTDPNVSGAWGGLFGSKTSDSWGCPYTYVPTPFGPAPVPPPPFQNQFNNYTTWVQEEDDDEPETFLAQITAPPTPARLFPTVFGDVPEMIAIGAARPTGGNIKEGKAEYIVQIVPVASAYWPIATVSDSPYVTLPMPIRMILH